MYVVTRAFTSTVKSESNWLLRNLHKTYCRDVRLCGIFLSIALGAVIIPCMTGEVLWLELHDWRGVVIGVTYEIVQICDMRTNDNRTREQRWNQAHLNKNCELYTWHTNTGCHKYRVPQIQGATNTGCHTAAIHSHIYNDADRGIISLLWTINTSPDDFHEQRAFNLWLSLLHPASSRVLTCGSACSTQQAAEC